MYAGKNHSLTPLPGLHVLQSKPLHRTFSKCSSTTSISMVRMTPDVSCLSQLVNMRDGYLQSQIVTSLNQFIVWLPACVCIVLNLHHVDQHATPECQPVK